MHRDDINHSNYALLEEFAEGCPTCSLKFVKPLLEPLASLPASQLSFYNDARFPGTCVLGLKVHAVHWDEIEPEILHLFIDDSQRVARAIRKATKCERVNLAVLGNQSHHIHMHFVPRYTTDPEPTRSPWSDPRPFKPFQYDEAHKVMNAIKQAL